jgi:membrane protein required for colicin V production
MIDIITVIAIAYAIFKGYTKGLIVAVFSVVGLLVGLAAAVKLSAIVAGWLTAHSKLSQQLIPSLAFLIVFLAAIWLVRLGAKMVEETIKFALLGWVNKLGGIAFFGIIYLTVLSVMLFYLEQIKFFDKATFSSSALWPYYKDWGAKAINGIGVVLPWFKNIFAQLQEFFGKVG